MNSSNTKTANLPITSNSKIGHRLSENVVIRWATLIESILNAIETFADPENMPEHMQFIRSIQHDISAHDVMMAALAIYSVCEVYGDRTTEWKRDEYKDSQTIVNTNGGDNAELRISTTYEIAIMVFGVKSVMSSHVLMNKIRVLVCSAVTVNLRESLYKKTSTIRLRKSSSDTVTEDPKSEIVDPILETVTLLNVDPLGKIATNVFLSDFAPSFDIEVEVKNKLSKSCQSRKRMADQESELIPTAQRVRRN